MSGSRKGYYIYYETNTDFIGVHKKIDNQIRVFNSCLKCEKLIVPREKKNVIKSILWRMPFGSFGRKYEKVFDMIDDKPDFLYIRFVPVDRRFLGFIKKLREQYPGTKILMEIPTYPYEGELTGSLTMFPFYFKDLFYRKKLGRYVDRIVTFSEDNKIFGIPTIRTRNGIVVDDYEVIHNEKQDNVIRLIAVALFRKEHGYERIIEGLSNYYTVEQTQRIEFHMVGNGKEVEQYRDLVKKFHLENYVIFHGKKGGDELEQLYNLADIGVGALGLYKSGQKKISTLKTPEYLAKGLPVIVGFPEEIFQLEPTEYVCEFPNDGSAIDMNRIIDFYHSVYTDCADGMDIHIEIHNYAKRMADMQMVMKPIIDYIEGEECKGN